MAIKKDDYLVQIIAAAPGYTALDYYEDKDGVLVHEYPIIGWFIDAGKPVNHGGKVGTKIYKDDWLYRPENCIVQPIAIGCDSEYLSVLTPDKRVIDYMFNDTVIANRGDWLVLRHDMYLQEQKRLEEDKAAEQQT